MSKEENEVNKTLYNWNIWFHRVDDKNWLIDSYKNIGTITCLEEYVYYYNKINTFTDGMFFNEK